MFYLSLHGVQDISFALNIPQCSNASAERGLLQTILATASAINTAFLSSCSTTFKFNSGFQCCFFLNIQCQEGEVILLLILFCDDTPYEFWNQYPNLGDALPLVKRKHYHVKKHSCKTNGRVKDNNKQRKIMNYRAVSMNGTKNESKAFPLAWLFNTSQCWFMTRMRWIFLYIWTERGRREKCAFSEQDQHIYTQAAVVCFHLSLVNSYLLDAGAVKLIPDH